MATAFTSLCFPQTSVWLLLLGDKGGSIQCYQTHTNTLRQVGDGGVFHLPQCVVWSETLMIGHWGAEGGASLWTVAVKPPSGCQYCELIRACSETHSHLTRPGCVCYLHGLSDISDVFK